VTVGVLLVYGLGTLNVLTFPIIRIAQSFENITDISHATVHRLANGFVTLALIEHLGNLTARNCTFSIWVPVRERKSTPRQAETMILRASVWIFLPSNITLIS
jgi:hypothetical protein